MDPPKALPRGSLELARVGQGPGPGPCRGGKVMFCSSKTYFGTQERIQRILWNSSPDPADPADPPDQMSSPAARALPSSRAGGQDDSSSTQAPSNELIICTLINYLIFSYMGVIIITRIHWRQCVGENLVTWLGGSIYVKKYATACGNIF